MLGYVFVYVTTRIYKLTQTYHGQQPVIFICTRLTGCLIHNTIDLSMCERDEQMLWLNIFFPLCMSGCSDVVYISRISRYTRTRKSKFLALCYYIVALSFNNTK
ncbi:hypothetical protein GQX74_008939 [Glossina fuscipes]|nr:hypothetical protein GQX74_008939 [Glossina fuscipes]